MEAAHIDIPEPLEAALKAVDEWATEQTPVEAPEPEPYAEQTTRVLAELKAWVDGTVNRIEMRRHPDAGGRKAGRELSKANVDALREAHRIIGELLARNEKPDEEAVVEAAKAVAEFERLQASLLGVTTG
jgi:hypothetical protein